MGLNCSIDIDKIDKQRLYLIRYKIEESKLQIFNNYKDDKIMGPRYHDSEGLVLRFLSEIAYDLYKDQFMSDNIKFNEQINKKMLSMSSKKTMFYIKKTIENAIDADYYYTYEKEW